MDRIKRGIHSVYPDDPRDPSSRQHNTNEDSMKITVFVPSIRPDTLPAAIGSILRQQWTNWELLVVGQGDYPTLEATLKQAGGGDRRIRCARLPGLGVSLARNAGVAQARGDVVAMMDDDCQAREDWLAVIAQTFHAHPDAGLVSGALVAPRPTPGRVWMCPSVAPPHALYDPALTPNRPPNGWTFVTANCAVRRHVACDVGPFDPYLGTGGHFSAGGDTDWGMRLERAKVKMVSTPDSVVYHTYGIRYGLRAVLRMSRAYARGNGAVAGKLTLQGDLRGAEWLKQTRQECTVGALHPARLHRMPFSLNRLHHFQAAYDECMTRFRVDERGLLQSRDTSPDEGKSDAGKQDAEKFSKGKIE